MSGYDDHTPAPPEEPAATPPPQPTQTPPPAHAAAAAAVPGELQRNDSEFSDEEEGETSKYQELDDLENEIRQASEAMPRTLYTDIQPELNDNLAPGYQRSTDLPPPQPAGVAAAAATASPQCSPPSSEKKALAKHRSGSRDKDKKSEKSEKSEKHKLKYNSLPAAPPKVNYDIPALVDNFTAEDMLGEPLVRDWNTEYQKCLKMPEGAVKEQIAKHEAIIRLANDFLYAAKAYGKIIINEFELKTADERAMERTKELPKGDIKTRKTIKPILKGGKTPGLAGGTKFLAAGILFKFSTDSLLPKSTRYVYSRTETPAPHWAMKAGSHELKGLIALMNASDKIPGLHLPLQAIITYRGHRLLAMPMLPIAGSGPDKTLRYGSEDGGSSFYCEDKNFTEMMKLLGEKLNLAPHHPPDNTFLNGKHPNASIPTMNNYMCTDIEAHLGKDGRMYVLDLARVFPPDNLDSKSAETIKTEGWKFYQMLRPEFVLNYSHKLSSDAFSDFTCKADRQSVDDTANAACVYLQQVTIEGFAEALSKKPKYQLVRLTVDVDLHQAGINLRHLGRVRRSVRSEGGRTALLMEIVVRTAKNRLREKLRASLAAEEGLPLFEPHRDVIVEYFNQLLESPKYWTDAGELKKECNYYFSFAIDKAETGDLRTYFTDPKDLLKFFRRLCKLSGIKLSKSAVRSLKEEGKNFISTSFRFKLQHIKKMGAVVKHMHLVEYSRAKLLMLSLSEHTQHTAQVKRTLQEASDLFEKAHAANTTHTGVLYEWALCKLETVDRGGYTGYEATRLLEDAQRLLEICVKLHNKYNEKDLQVVITYVSVLIRLSTLAEATNSRQLQQEAESHLASVLEKNTRSQQKAVVAKILKVATEASDKLPCDLFLAESIDPSTNQFLLENINNDTQKFDGKQIKAFDALFAGALLWHRVALRFNRTPFTLLRTADILRRWAVFRNRFATHFPSGTNASELFARSALLFDLSLQFHLSFSDGTHTYNVSPDDVENTKTLQRKLKVSTDPQPLGLAVLHTWASECTEVLYENVSLRVQKPVGWVLEADAGPIDLRQIRFTASSEVAPGKEVAHLFIFKPPKADQKDLHPVDYYNKMWEEPNADKLIGRSKRVSILASDREITEEINAKKKKTYKYLFIKIVPLAGAVFSLKSLQVLGFIDLGEESAPSPTLTISLDSPPSAPPSPSAGHQTFKPQIYRAKPLESALSSNANLFSLLRTSHHSSVLRHFVGTFLNFRATLPARKKLQSSASNQIAATASSFIHTVRTITDLSPESPKFDFHQWLKLRPLQNVLSRYPYVYLQRYHQHHQVLRMALDTTRISLKESQSFFFGRHLFDNHQLLKNVRLLDLRGSTNITDEDLLEVIRQIKASIRSLNLRDSPLGSVPFFTALVKEGIKITDLHVRESITREEIIYLSRNREKLGLEYFDLTGAQIGGKALKEIASQSWTGLTLVACTFKQTTKASELARLPCDKLQALSLASVKDYEFEDAFVRPVLQQLQNATQLVFLDLSYTHLRESQSLLGKLTSLKYLTLEGCSSLDGTEFGHLTTLTKLVEVNLRPKRGNIHNPLALPSEVLTKLAGAWTHLNVFLLGKWKTFDDKSLGKMIDANSSTLRYVDIQIARQAQKETAAALEKCSKLMALQAEGCEGLSPYIEGILRHCTRLQRVGLQGLAVTDANLEPLLKNNKSGLHTLILSATSVATNQTLKLISGYHSDSVRILVFTGCVNITADAVLDLAQQCANLQYLDLSSCSKLQKTDLEMIRLQLPDTTILM